MILLSRDSWRKDRLCSWFKDLISAPRDQILKRFFIHGHLGFPYLLSVSTTSLAAGSLLRWWWRGGHGK